MLSLAALARRLRFFHAFVRLDTCPRLDLQQLLLAKALQEQSKGTAMRAHAAMSPNATLRTGHGIDERRIFTFLY